MNYNEWKRINSQGTVKQYIEYCRQNRIQINLSGADLRGADLRGADLGMADLNEINLSKADLSGADLSGADLRMAAMRVVNLTGADLTGADLSWADLTEASLTGANLTGAAMTGGGPVTVGAFGRHLAIAAGGQIFIGYEHHPYQQWLEQYNELLKGYSPKEIADYGAWIGMAVERQRQIETE